MKPHWAVALLAPLLLAGCQGSGRIEMTALNYQDIDPPPAKFTAIDLDRCTWWTDDQGQLWIAMQRNQPVYFGLARLNFTLSLVLKGLPAGSARDYQVSRRELRGRVQLGPAQNRFVSLAGIVALYREGPDHLRGSFRLDVTRHSQALLGGWSPGSRYLMLGNFVAVPDDGRGREIAAATEEWGFERPPTTAPATLPIGPLPNTDAEQTPESGEDFEEDADVDNEADVGDDADDGEESDLEDETDEADTP